MRASRNFKGAMNVEATNETGTNPAGAQSRAGEAGANLSVGLGIPSREQLVWALCEVLDGTWTWYDLQADTGLPQGECETLLAIRNAVKQQWVDSGMKMPNV